MTDPRAAQTNPSGGMPVPATQLLQRAAALYGRGNLAGAEAACRQLLQLRPQQPDALHILGLIAWRRGDRPQAAADIGKAIASDPRRPQPHNSLGVLLKEAGDPAGAEAAFRTAIGLQADYPEALTNLGNILCETGRLTEAEAAHRRVVELTPRYADGHNNLATALARQERWEEAVEECRRAVALDPARAEFQLNLGNALSALEDWREAAAAFRLAAQLAPGNADAHANLGIALFYLNEHEEARAAHRVATQLRPDSAYIWANLAVAQIDLGDAEGAMQSCRRALELDPNLPEAHNCMGKVLKALDRPREAIAAYEEAIRLRPDYGKAYNNLGIALNSQCRFTEALAAYARAIELVPDYPEARWDKGHLHLLRGEFEEGWRGYEYGLGIKHGRTRSTYGQFPVWDGSPLAGKTILVLGEQGVGDQIMFASLLPDLVQRGATCIVKMDDRLQPLLHRSMPDLRLVSRKDSELSDIDHTRVDYQSRIGSLCQWLRPTLASFPLRQSYLEADPDLVAIFRERYRARFGSRLIVGISWRGGTGEIMRLRSIPLSAWSSILRQEGVGFVNLQYGDCRADLEAVRSGMGVEIFHDDAVDPLKSLDDFAAQTAAMDLVISVDNSTVHLAGALNVPVWIMVPAVPDWRWMLDRSDSPWYSSVRLFRQPSPREWSPVLLAVAEELGQAVRLARHDQSDEPMVARREGLD